MYVSPPPGVSVPKAMVGGKKLFKVGRVADVVSALVRGIDVPLEAIAFADCVAPIKCVRAEDAVPSLFFAVADMTFLSARNPSDDDNTAFMHKPFAQGLG